MPPDTDQDTLSSPWGVSGAGPPPDPGPAPTFFRRSPPTALPPRTGPLPGGAVSSSAALLRRRGFHERSFCEVRRMYENPKHIRDREVKVRLDDVQALKPRGGEK